MIPKLKKVNGQGLIEFALALPILLLLVIGTLDLGAAFFMKVELENSAREGAYYMVYHMADDIANGKDPFALAKTAVQIEGENAGITIPTSDISVTCLKSDGSAYSPPTCPSGSTVLVTVRHNMTFALDIFSSGPLKLTNDARMLIP